MPVWSPDGRVARRVGGNTLQNGLANKSNMAFLHTNWVQGGRRLIASPPGSGWQVACVRPPEARQNAAEDCRKSVTMSAAGNPNTYRSPTARRPIGSRSALLLAAREPKTRCRGQTAGRGTRGPVEWGLDQALFWPPPSGSKRVDGAGVDWSELVRAARHNRDSSAGRSGGRRFGVGNVPFTMEPQAARQERASQRVD